MSPGNDGAPGWETRGGTAQAETPSHRVAQATDTAPSHAEPVHLLLRSPRREWP
jgi:hypothetical protein